MIKYPPHRLNYLGKWVRFRNPQFSPILVGIADQGLMSCYNFFINILIARWFGLQIFGVYTTIFLVYLVGFVACRSSVVSPCYAIFQDEETRRSEYDFFLKIYTAGVSLVLAALGVIAVDLLLPNGPAAVAVSNIAIFFFIFTLLAQGSFRFLHFGAGRQGTALGLDMLQTALGIGGLFVLSWLSVSTIDRSVAVLAVAAGIPVLISLFYSGSAVPSFSTALIFHRRHWLSSRWLLPANMMTVGYEYSFTLGAGIIFGEEALGILRIIQQIFSFVVVPLQSFETFLPRYFVLRYREIDRDLYIALTLQITILTAALFVGLSAMIYGFSSWLSAALYHLNLDGSQTMAALYALSVPLMAARTVLSTSLRACEHAQPIFVASVVSAILAAITIGPLFYALNTSGTTAGILLVEAVSVGLLARAMSRIPLPHKTLDPSLEANNQGINSLIWPSDEAALGLIPVLPP